jgi:2-octaprenyl-6-methoxyphenol hydroxylase
MSRHDSQQWLAYHLPMDTQVDIAIVGGGLVGSSLAIALDGCGWRVAQIEAVAATHNRQASVDERNLALARVSVDALDALGVWSELAPHATLIRRIQVTRRGEFGRVRLRAEDYHLDAFGAVVPARELGNGLLKRIEGLGSLTRWCPARVTATDAKLDGVDVGVSIAGVERRLRTRLLVAADGTDSGVRAALGIGVDIHDYAQTAFVGTVQTERALDGEAFERFTDSGPVALLPLPGARAGFVMTVANAQAQSVAMMNDATFVALLQERFGYRLGRLKHPGRRIAHPLRRVQAQALTAARAVLIGNAAQTVHPIGAQGFNLGLRDALSLAALLRSAASAKADPGSPQLLAEYAQQRSADRQSTIAASDGLVRLFGEQALPLRILRSLGMTIVDRSPSLKRMLARRGMGLTSGTLLALPDIESAKI